ncbi:MAG: EscR/YscR/HrcR family type III secretion system export apparatus protein [Isosphaeraceae bacterium]|nr:EscR/YscR/HrcR family type III secretion system export apparatus protein [Isosphaeraceae bacterium]
MTTGPVFRPRRATLWAVLALLPLLGAGSPPARTHDAGVAPTRLDVRVAPTPSRPEAKPSKPADTPTKPVAEPAAAQGKGLGAGLITPETLRSVQSVALFALISFAPAAILMVTAFVRINIVLLLLRQALGSPQVPGNQVLTVLALLLTALVMRPVAETVYTDAVAPFAAGRASAAEAWAAGTKPVKAFMLEQIERTNHHHYVWTLYEHTVKSPGEPEPKYGEDFPLRVVAPAFLLSELTTALTIGFYLYLPFLVIDLVVSAVLASMGLFMLPPSLVALPLKLILFVLADGWLLVAAMLLQSFGGVP